MKQYAVRALSTVLLLAGGVVLFNLWADPLCIYRFRSADADRMSRIDQTYTMRLSKPWQAAQIGADAAVIGSSRTGAIRPRHRNWGNIPSFNLSMPGITLYEMKRTIEHARSRGTLSRLVIGLDYDTFIAGDYRTGLGFEEARLSPPYSPGFLWQAVIDLRDTLLTTRTLTRSATAISGRSTAKTRFRPDGSWQPSPGLWWGQSGYVSAGKHLVRLSRSNSQPYRENMTILGEILRFCHENDIALSLFLSPEHLFITDLRHRIGQVQFWKSFHRDIVALNETMARDKARAPFPLWGFNLLQGVVDEPLPEGPGSTDEWFRDGIHFNDELGQVLMDAMLGSSRQDYLLDSTSVDDYLDQITRMRAEFVKRHQDAIKRLRQKVLANT